MVGREDALHPSSLSSRFTELDNQVAPVELLMVGRDSDFPTAAPTFILSPSWNSSALSP